MACLSCLMPKTGGDQAAYFLLEFAVPAPFRQELSPWSSLEMHACMDGWMDGDRVGGWMNGWMGPYS